MKRYEKGQGLVEYALILTLSSIIVIGLVALLGPQIGGVFCDTIWVLSDGSSGDFDSSLVVSMDLSDTFVTFGAVWPEDDVGGAICNDVIVVEEFSEPSHGDLEVVQDGIFLPIGQPIRALEQMIASPLFGTT